MKLGLGADFNRQGSDAASIAAVMSRTAGPRVRKQSVDTLSHTDGASNFVERHASGLIASDGHTAYARVLIRQYVISFHRSVFPVTQETVR